MKQALVIGGLDNIVREIDEELRQATLGGGIVAQDGGKGRVAQRFRQALAQRFASAGVVA